MTKEHPSPGVLGSISARPIWEPLLTSEEAADRFRVHPKTVIRMARNHDLPAVRIGKLWRFRESDLARWAEDQVESTRQSSERSES